MHRQSLHRLVMLKQSKAARWRFADANARWFSTQRRSAAQLDSGAARVAFLQTRIGTAVNRSSGRAPFASTLRPNLTGGTLNRTAGGYALGAGGPGSVRYFSHMPASPSQVAQQASQAVRAFLMAGQKARFEGVDPRTGAKRYEAVTALQDHAACILDHASLVSPGSFVDFSVGPAITAVSPSRTLAVRSDRPRQLPTLNAEGFLEALSVDFAHSLKSLAAVLADLKRIAALGDLPVTYQDTTLRVHFPGCDVTTVDRLCAELGVQRGVVGQDESFDDSVGAEMALRFPLAPSQPESENGFEYDAPDQIEWRDMIMSPPCTVPTPAPSTRVIGTESLLSTYYLWASLT